LYLQNSAFFSKKNFEISLLLLLLKEKVNDWTMRSGLPGVTDFENYNCLSHKDIKQKEQNIYYKLHIIPLPP
jgi:hypothetical protein